MRNRVYFESLESRVLLSGGVEGALVDTELLAYEGFSQAPVAAEIAFLEEAHGTALLDLSGSADPHPKMQSDLLEGLAMRELVFFDGNLAGCQQLIADLQRADGNRNIEVVALESDRNGIEQVSEILSERSNLTAVHFITHGTEGQINLGNTWLNRTTLQQHADTISAWGNALAETGDILFYGCNIAAGREGESLLNAISDLTGADVAASDDPTGSATLGGDWDLERQTGPIETPVVIDAVSRPNWTQILALTAYEPFAYSTGSLNYANGGTGWANAWAYNTNSLIATSTGLQDPTSAMTVSGGTSELNLSYYGTVDQSRDLSTLIGAPGTTAWMSFLVKPGGTNTGDYAGLKFGNASVQRAFAGYTEGGYFAVEEAGGAGTVRVNGIRPTAGQTSLLVVRMDFTSGADTLTLYVNPTPGLDSPDSTFTASRTDLNLGTFTSVWLSGGRELTGNDAQLDELRIGSSFLDVAPMGSRIAGTVINDVDGDADIAEAGTLVFSGATVRLWSDTGDAAPGSGDTLVRTTTTNASGQYSFSGLPDGTYWVTVDSKTLGASGYNSGYAADDVWADQTYGAAGAASGASYLSSAGTLYGGRNRTASDAASALSTSEHITRVSVASQAITGIDYGFSFSAITNGRGNATDDDGTSTGRLQQGSLRQFLINSNAMAGTQEADFSVGSGLITITPTSALPTITDDVVLDATTQEGFTGAPLVELNGSSAGSGASGFVLSAGASGSTIRGFVINRFGVHLIQLAGSDNNIIAGNYLGTDATGMVDQGAGDSGVMLSGGASGNRIGGTTAADRNVLSGNNYSGVSITGSGTNNNRVQGNLIGTAADGISPLGNTSFGVVIWDGASGNLIGGAVSGAGNLIANNSRGVIVDALSLNSLNNAILGNRIFANATLGIDLYPAGVRANDLGDGDSGPNNYQNYPVLFIALSTSGNTTITGSLNSVANTTYRIEFFSNPTGDASGYGEGEVYIGSTTLTTDASGNASFNTTLVGVTVASGHALSATATVDLGGGNYGSTSEFAANLSVNTRAQVGARQDSYIKLKNPTLNYGTATTLVVDRETTDLQRALLQFDLSAIPANAIITSATLTMQSTQIDGTLNINVYEMLRAWTEGNANGTVGAANWGESTAGTSWTSAGGDFNPTAVANLNTNTTGQHAWNLTSLVQAWVNGTKSNYGVMVASPDGGGNRTAAYSSSEGATPPRLTISYTVPVNTAPTLDGTKSPALGSISEDAGAPSGTVGTLVSSLVDFAVPAGQVDNVTELDSGALLGLAITAADTGNGTWYYSTDNGINWNLLGAVADTNARLLAANVNTRLYFEPNANTNGTLSNAITFRAWDQTTGSNGALADTSSNGGTTAFSTATDTAGLVITAINDAPVGVPTLTGTPSEDQILTADTSGLSDADGLGPFSYQWLRDGANISGGTGSTYTLGDGDVGARISVQVSYTDGQGTNESLTSVQTAPVANVNDAPKGLPVITGAVTEDQTLTADTSGLSDDDGLGPFSYQWLRDGANISGGTGSTYTLGDADVGTRISVQVSYTDGQGTNESLTSAQTAAVANVNDAPTGAPAITGAATEDQTITADVSGISDAEGLGPFSYQWLRNGVAMGGATNSTYTLGDADVGAQIRVRVSYTDGQGTSESLTSAQTAVVANVNDAPVGVPTLTGTPTEDQILTADTSGVSDADGLGAFSYQWLRNGANIAGGTGSTFTLGAEDVGTRISVQVSYTDGQGTDESLTSAQTAPVANVNDTPAGVPVITGAATKDQTLTADTSGISDADGLGPFSYQWLRNGMAMGGAANSTYILGDADVGTQISVQVSYTDGQGTDESLTSATVGPVVNVNAIPVGVPTISGTATEDQTISADVSGISDADGLGPFSYQWLRNGVAMGGATDPTYTLGDADVGTQIRVQVSYTDGHGVNESLTSAQTAAVANVNDAPVGVPTITGTPTEDQTLTANTSGLSDADGLGSFSYQWLRNGVAMGGATNSAYTLGDADVGTQIRVRVSYTDGHGTNEILTSAQTAAVANVNDAPTGAAVITGAATEDQTLTADTSWISDADGLGAFSYQWLRNGVAMGGATNSIYTLGDPDVGSQIRVQVRYTDGHGTSESLTSAQTAPVANVNDAPVGVPMITGTVTEDQTLTANTGGISDADGLGFLSYQWLRNGSNIAGATGITHTLGDADVGSRISVQVSYTDGHGTDESLTSVQTVRVTNVNDAPAGVPVIIGAATEAQTLAADTSGISDSDGLGPLSYQWLRGGVAIAGATNATHTLGDADVGSRISVQVSYTDGHGTDESLTSAQTAAIANVNDAPTGLPGINGTMTEDQTLTVDVSGISDSDGLGVLSYQWLRHGLAIGGATNSTYTLGDADVGAQISVQVSYTDGRGTNESLTSAQTAAIANVNDAPTGLPSIIGTATEDQVLTADTSGLSDADGLGVFSYQWLRNGANIAGGTGSTYTLGDSDVGAQISVQVSYADGHGTAESVTSAQTAAVAHVNDAPTVAVTNGDDPGTTPVPIVDNPRTADIGNPTDLVAPQTVPLDTPSSPFHEYTYQPLGGGGTVNKPEKISKEEAPDADGSGESTPTSNQPSEQGHVPSGPPTGTELASLLLTKESSPNTETARDERSTTFQKQGLRAQGPLGVMRASDYEHLRDSLDAVKQEITSDSRLGKVYLGSALVSSIGLSVGYVVWMLRGGMLLASLLSSMPAWQFLDPLPILARKKEDEHSEDKESLDSIVNKQAPDVNPKKKTADGSPDAEEKRR